MRGLLINQTDAQNGQSESLQSSELLKHNEAFAVVEECDEILQEQRTGNGSVLT